MLERSLQFAGKLGLQWPVIIQAPMAGGITTPRLVAAVSNLNGLGSFATGYLTSGQVEAGIQEIKKLTSKPFAVNIFIPNEAYQDKTQIQAYTSALDKFKQQLNMPKESHLSSSSLLPEDNFRDIVNIILREKVPIVSFAFGNLPEDVIAEFKRNGTLLIGTAASLEEAKILVNAGVDAVVAQGHEAGGHRGGFFTPFKNSSVGTMALLPRIVDAIDRPVVAAGGIMDSRGIVAAMSLGAAAIQMGTAFLTTIESGANPTYKEALLDLKKHDVDMTTITDVYSGKMVRAIKNEFIEHMEATVAKVPPYPITNSLSTPLRKEAAKQKATNIMSMWSGQGVPLITEQLSVEEFLSKLRKGIDEFINAFSNIRLTKQ